MSHFIFRWKIPILISLGFVWGHAFEARAAVCSLNADYDPRASAPVTIEMSLSCPRLFPNSSAVWSMGDGNFVTGNPISHTYIQDGPFEVVVEGSGRYTTISRTIHVPAFDILDDFEDSAASLIYWQLPDDPEIQGQFLGRFQARMENGVPNVEFKTVVFGPGGPDGGGHYGGSGLILPPVGGGGQNPITWPPDALPAGSAEGQISFDFRYDMIAARNVIGGSGLPIKTVVMHFIGTESMLIAGYDGARLGLRLERPGAESSWLSLGPGTLDTRVTVRIVRSTSQSVPVMTLDWQLTDGSSGGATLMNLASSAEVIGFSATNSVAYSIDGTLPDISVFGNFYYDNFEFAHHAD